MYTEIHQDAGYTFSGFKNLESKETLLILSIILKLVDDSPTPMTLGQGWHILRIKFKKSSPADKIGFNWRKLDKSGENWRKLILTIEGE